MKVSVDLKQTDCRISLQQRWVYSGSVQNCNLGSATMGIHVQVPQKNEKKTFFFFFFFLGPQPWDTEVPRLGVESKPQGWKQSCSCRPTPQPQEHWLWAAPVTYAAACGNAGSLTHRVRPGMELAFSWILVRLLTCWATTGTPRKTLLERGNIRKVIVNEEPMAFHWLSPWQERKVFLCVKAPLFWSPNSI